MEWFNSMQDEIAEFSNAVQERNMEYVKGTKLYAVLKERLDSVKEDENVIFFIPYPIVFDTKSSIFLQFTTDYLQATYNQLKEENLIGERRIFFIYPSMESSIYVLRDENYHREYIKCSELDDLVVFETDLK